MNKNEIVIKIIHIPQEFHNLHNVSVYSLLEKTGYFETYKQITEEDILNVLIKYPDLINDWLSWSADKRCSPTWYFLEELKTKYIVGYFSHDKKEKQRVEYSDALVACASFIKQEIEEIRKDEKNP